MEDILIIKNKKTIFGHLLAILTVCVWGTTFIATKYLLEYFTPIEILFFRFLIAYFALFLVYPKIFKFTNWKCELLILLGSLSSITIYQYLENIALVYTSASNVSIIVACAAFFTGIFAKLFLKTEKVSLMFLLGFIVSIVGIVLITFNGSIILKFSPKGDILALFAAILWGIYSVIVKIVSKYNYNPLQVTRRIMLYGVITLIPMCLFSGADLSLTRFITGDDSIRNLLLTLFLGLIASALCFSTWNIAVDYLGAVKTSLYVYCIPLVTIIFANIFLNEKITLIGSIGTIVTLGGLYISNIKLKTK